MAKRPTAPIGVDSASGHAAWFLACALMERLREKRILSRQDGIEIIDRALSDCEQADEQIDLQGLRVSRDLLEMHQATVAGTPRRRLPQPRKRKPS